MKTEIKKPDLPVELRRIASNRSAKPYTYRTPNQPPEHVRFQASARPTRAIMGIYHALSSVTRLTNCKFFTAIIFNVTILITMSFDGPATVRSLLSDYSFVKTFNLFLFYPIATLKSFTSIIIACWNGIFHQPQGFERSTIEHRPLQKSESNWCWQTTGLKATCLSCVAYAVP